MEQHRRRIVIFNPAAYSGGAERGLLEIVSALGANYWIKVVHPSGGELEKILQDHSVSCDLPNFTRLSRKGSRLVDVWKSSSDVARLFRVINDLKPDLVISNGIKAHYAISLYKRFHSGVLFVPYIRDASSNGIIRNRIFQAMVLRVADHIIFTTEYLKHMYNPSGQCSVLPNPVFGSAAAVSRKSVSSDQKVIGIVAHLAPLKGIEDALFAFRELRGKFGQTIRLHIAGGNIYDTNRNYYDRYAISLNNLIQRIGSDEISMKAYSFSEMDGFYSQLDVLVNCSRSEGFGRSVAEAINSGIPFVTTESGYWDRRKYPFLEEAVYTPGNIEELCKKIEICLKRPFEHSKIIKLIGPELNLDHYQAKINKIMEVLFR